MTDNMDFCPDCEHFFGSDYDLDTDIITLLRKQRNKENQAFVKAMKEMSDEEFNQMIKRK